MARFPVEPYLATALAAGAAAAISLPFWRAACWRWGLVDDPGARKIHTAPVPLAGGLAVLTGLAAPLLLGMAALHWGWLEAETAARLAHGLGKRGPQLLVILAGALGMAALGLWDDRRELPPAPKFAGQCLVALLTAWSGVRITLFVAHPLFSYTVTVLWIVVVTNAVNFLDNMNGLCGGLAAIAAGWFAALAMHYDQYLVGLLAVATAAAFAGFLPFNFPCATVFLGDAGSHLAGYLLAVLAILPHFYTPAHPRPWSVLAPLAVLAVPLLDLVWVVVARWRRGQPFYQGDTTHLSHRLVRRGLSPAAAVVVVWLLGLAGGSVAWLLL